MIVPRWFAGIVVCECGAPMEAIGFDGTFMEDGGHWLYWHCERGHSSCGIPFPDALREAWDASLEDRPLPLQTPAERVNYGQ